jgi:hypothetical protein
MRTLGFRTHILLVIAGAVGVLGALGRPWYDTPPAPVERTGDFVGSGPLYGLADTLERWLTASGGVTGWHALGTWGTVLAALSLCSVAGALACLTPALQGLAREPLRYLSFAAFAVAVWKLVDQPGANAALELRVGAFAGVAAAGMLWICAQGVAGAPSRRRVEPSRYTPPPAPTIYDPR